MEENVELYFLLIIQNRTTPVLRTYNDWDDCIAAYYTELGYRHESRTSTLCVILNADFMELRRGEYPEMAPN